MTEETDNKKSIYKRVRGIMDWSSFLVLGVVEGLLGPLFIGYGAMELMKVTFPVSSPLLNGTVLIIMGGLMVIAAGARILVVLERRREVANES